MFINQFRLRLFGMSTVPFIRNEFHVRIFVHNGFYKQWPAFVIRSSTIFVSYFHIFQVEWLRMSILCSYPAPNRSYRSVGIFNCIKGILHPLPHLVKRNYFAVRHTHVDAVKRFSSQILCQLKVFVETKTISSVVAPKIPKWSACIYVSNGFFPLIHLFHFITFYPASARKTKKFGVNSIKCFGKVGAQAMIFPCFIREQ